MKLISYNVNGIRAAMKKGLVVWLKSVNPDVFCVQEAKAHQEQVDLSSFKKMGYQIYWYPAEKKGYSGVVVFTKIKPLKVTYGVGIEKYDFEGRTIKIDFEDFTLLNIYFPSGTTGEVRQDFKYMFLDDYYEMFEELKKTKSNLIICGDFNICHTDIDIHNPKKNQKTSGFLPEERAWMNKLFDNGFTDAFRQFHQEPHNYTWWSYRAGSRQKNLGWRIDYFAVSNQMTNRLKDCQILSKATHSDHCPVLLEIN